MAASASGSFIEFVDTVIYVVGLSGLGQPLDVDHVHRPERFAHLSGLSIGDAITPEAIAKVLHDPLGGLKNIPTTARRIAVLNQADTAELQAQAQIIARQLLPAYQAVAITALKYQQIFAVHEPTAGIILAAGAASVAGKLSAPEGETKELRGFRVFLIPAEQDAADNILRYAETRPGGDGKFILRNLVPGTYRLLTWPEANLPGSARELPFYFSAFIRQKLRQAAAQEPSITLKPCQSLANVILRIP